MTWSVYQHWDPLQVCAVGRSYPPEFYSWITVPHVRELFERIAVETEEDYQGIIAKLTEFGVEVLRPDLPATAFVDGKFQPPPMTPRDYTLMAGTQFYENYSFDFKKYYDNIRADHWPDCSSVSEVAMLPQSIQDEMHTVHNLTEYISRHPNCYQKIFDRVAAQGNNIKSHVHLQLNGAYVARVGCDLYFGTENYEQHTEEFVKIINQEFVNTRNHIVNTGGHSDGTYCPVTPGLIISLRDVKNYDDTFPGWEVVYLPNQSFAQIKPFWDLKKKNRGRWWIPGFEYDQDVLDVVETWLGHWVGYVEETVFDVNMLIIDPKNVMVFNYNEQVFDALDRYGVTPHIVPFRHRYFWDGGIHCVTSDLHRAGVSQDFFPERNNV